MKPIKPLEPFSKRHGIHAEPPITVWNDAPEEFRTAVLTAARESCDIRPHNLREIVCGALRKRPDESNWSEYPNVWQEVQAHFYGCDWFRVYDIVEAIQAYLAKKAKVGTTSLEMLRFETEVNSALRDLGIGWHLIDGVIQARGDDAFETVVSRANAALAEASKDTAYNELQEALKDISRRPEPDSTGAIQHAMASLECVAKDVTGQSKATLGEILKKHGTIIPKPLDDAVHKTWGFASDKARHVREGEAVSREEAQLVVGLAASLAFYLIQKTREETE